MGSYKIISGQNLYDVGLHIYGSIEGITDLLICNPALSMASPLSSGQELKYSDDYLIDADTAAYNRTNGIVPANGERNVYFKESRYPMIAELRILRAMTSARIVLSGTGAVEIDWGDNTPLEMILLSGQNKEYRHSFNNAISGNRKIRLYGDFELRDADLTELTPSDLFLLRPLYAEQLTLKKSRLPLDFLPLFNGLCKLDLTGIRTESLLPVVECRELMALNLTEVNVPRHVLDSFLIALVKRHYGRRSCTVTLTELPGGEYREPERDEELNYVISTGMEAVWLLTHEPTWNEAGEWIFKIQDQIYTYEPND